MTDLTGIDQLPSGAWRFRLQFRGEILSGTAATAELAAELRDEMKRQIVDGQLAPTKGASAKTLGPRFLASRAGNRDTDNDSSRWHNHVATAAWARRALKTVTRQDGVAWLATLKAKRAERPKSEDPKRRGGRHAARLSVSTRKHCLVLARRFFEWALEQGHYELATNPFAGLHVEREDGDEDQGYQDTWYLDALEQGRFLAAWDDPQLDFDAGDRAEKWLAAFAIGTGLRESEQWCLHLDDVHVDADEANPRVEVRFGSYDPVKRRFRPPKGRKGEKRRRTVHLHGLALEAMRTWLAVLPTYAPENPKRLVFPTRRGALRVRPPRTWDRVVEAFGSVARIGREVWWHLLRHTFASSLVSGWWGMRWSLEDVSKELGHTDVRTTQIYAHLAPQALAETAARARASYAGSCHGAVTGQRPAARSARNDGHARQDSDLRHSASKALESAARAVESGAHDSAVTAVTWVLREVAAGRLATPPHVVVGLELALDALLGLVDAKAVVA